MLMLEMSRPFWRTPRKRTPRNVPNIVPTPPTKLVPPSSTAAAALNSIPAAVSGAEAGDRDAVEEDPDRDPAEDHDHHRAVRADALLEELRDAHARQGERAADRQVEAADEEDEGESHAEDQERRVRLEDVEEVRP